MRAGTLQCSKGLTRGGMKSGTDFTGSEPELYL